MSEHPQILIETPQQLRDWLQVHHGQRESVWLVRWKKDSGKPYFSYDELVDELMCFGWVDSLPRALNEHQSMIRISPRNPKSNWSRVNKERVDRLTKSRRMEEAGLAMVQLAKKNGTWDFLNDVEALILPSDLEAALKKNPGAAHYYERFPDSSKRGILEWIKNAKQAETRQKRIKEVVEKAAQNRKANHPKGRDAGPRE